MSIGEKLYSLLDSITSFGNDILWGYVLIFLLIGAGIYFTIRSKFVQFRLFKEMFRVIKEEAIEQSGSKGTSAFQAFSISIASRVGTGNLAGVALAIAVGGPGAVFWMWFIALIGAGSAFVESTLAQVYKVRDGDGFRGGPAYYMEKALGQKWMGILFSVLITLCFGLVFNAVQANTISMAFEEAFGANRALMGMILVIMTALIIFGGLKRIAKVAQVIVPVMAVVYLIVAFYVLVINITEIPALIALIVQHAFGLEQAVGGGIGAALMQGLKRGLFSNEAGMGSAPNAAATAGVSHPVKQGLVQTLAVFTDTLLICSATAFMILLYSDYTMASQDGIQLTQAALSAHIGEWAAVFVAIAIFLFAFSSVIGNYYYGETNVEFMKDSNMWLQVYRFAVLGMVMFGSMAKIQLVWDMADLFMAMMAIVNLIAILLLGKIAFAVLQDYIEQRKQGKDPVFYASRIKELKNVEWWTEQEGK
ncbi:AGCS family alanine or glycine:cation symporter [Melghiribacillus thermohalophilus]|uniref:AGCS family alanine or glycine:cation symporter n=1 Tax=Melghiribacillus thermohalophilus TaxID=1324956 RepID=A0A4R3N900_9BACI|nr:alanine/glycine:cation symporter family protein [Melghiribacillus thermohalophilus]TCT25087.1 AGCS family alanine or glycine:cation symporter [Melghiribacillus thermohalophilus]